MRSYILYAILFLVVFGQATKVDQSSNDYTEWFSISNMLKMISDATGFDLDSSDINSNQPDVKNDYKNKRDDLIKKDKETYFTFDVTKLTSREKQVEEQLFKLRDKVVQGDHTPLKLDFYEGKAIVEQTQIHEVMHKLPKGAHLHLHTTAAIPLDKVMEFTKDDIVYYSFDENKLKAAPNGIDDPSYEKCNTIRKNWSKEGTFDEFLRNQIKLTAEDIANKESNSIWDKFQYKFSLTGGLVHFHKFYKQGVLAICQNAIDEKVNIVEIRHSSGRVVNDDGGNFSLDEEFALYQSVIDEIRKQEPNFELRIIISSSKAGGVEPVKEQIENYKYSKEHFGIVSGFDMVNEEDTTPPIIDFVETLEEAKKNIPDFNLYLHAGESTSRYNENLFDAILLGTKRIGHGLAIDFHPYLTELVKDNEIGYEICPISNYVLGYTLDLRWHPIRSLMSRGVAVTISSDDPSFWDYDGLTLDFTYAFLAWELDLKDLKQLAINSIKQSSLNENDSKRLLKHFHSQWEKFINDFHNSYMESE